MEGDRDNKDYAGGESISGEIDNRRDLLTPTSHAT
jgi:hypothetical protein